LWRVNGPPNTSAAQTKGVFVDVNLGALIAEIVVSPMSETWLTPTLAKLLDQLGLAHIPLRRSTLFDPPHWMT